VVGDALRRQSSQPSRAASGSKPAYEVEVALHPLFVAGAGVVAVSTDTVAAAFFVRSTMLVASTWYVPAVVAVKTPASVTEAPVGSWIDQFTPAVLAAPSTVAARVVGLLVSTETLAGVMVTFEYKLMTMNPLS
jgi:hypothetical protein